MPNFTVVYRFHLTYIYSLLVVFFNLALPEFLQGKITPKRWFSFNIAQRMHACSNLIEQLGTLFSKKIKMRCIPYL
jgi:hypothetical protein